MDKPRLVVSGTIAIDRIMNFSNRYKDLIKPDKIHTLSISVFIDKLKDTYGGSGANICYTLALLGDNPILFSSVGRDGKKYMDKLASDGVDISHIHYSDLPTASFNVITDAEDNQVGGFYPGAVFDSDSLSLEKWRGQNILAVVSPNDPKAMRRQVKECKEFGLKLFYDIGQQVSNAPADDILDGVEAAEILIVNDYEFAVICDRIGKNSDEIMKKVPIVIITKGKDGSVIDGKSLKTPIIVLPAKPESVTDPTGAGDSFRAGFLYGYIRDLPLDMCGKLGSVTAVYAVEKHGTQEHKFTKEEFAKRFKNTFGIECPIDK